MQVSGRKKRKKEDQGVQVPNTKKLVPHWDKDLTFVLSAVGLVVGLDRLEDISEEAMDTMIDTNVKGLVHVTQSVLPGMRKRNRGHVINIGSVAGHQAYGNGSIYCASKAAVASITKALLFETIDTAIRISEINPGTNLACGCYCCLLLPWMHHCAGVRLLL